MEESDPKFSLAFLELYLEQGLRDFGDEQLLLADAI
jgi:hypothetical protein